MVLGKKLCFTFVVDTLGDALLKASQSDCSFSFLSKFNILLLHSLIQQSTECAPGCRHISRNGGNELNINEKGLVLRMLKF